MPRLRGIEPLLTRSWNTSLPDWEERLFAGQPLVPDLPLFPREAYVALRCFKRLKIPDIHGTPTMEEACGPWFFPIVAALFGSLDRKTNRRHIREVFQLIPKGNGKSSSGGAVMLTALVINQRPEAEFLFVAPTIEIAAIAFKQAKGTIKLDGFLAKTLHIQDNIRKITNRETGATLQIKAADTEVITGSKALGTMIDETHEFARKGKAAEIFVELRGALAKRPDGFLWQTTTQSKAPPTGVFAAELEMARKVRDGKIVMPILPVLYELPDRLARDGGWKDRKLWPLINPNLGRSVDEAFLETQVTKAEMEGMAALALIASQHFNVQIGMSLRADGWAGAPYWNRGIEAGLTLDTLLERCEVVCVGVDGGGLDDLLGIAVIGREKYTKRWLAWAHALISPEGLDRRRANAAQYEKFQQDGDLTLVDGLPDDITYVVDIVQKIDKAGLLAKVGVDPYGVGALVDALAGIGVTQEAEKLEGVRQGLSLMTGIKAVERKLVDGTFKHGGQTLMQWCVGNARVVPVPTGMRIARDESGYGKIDPLMALFNAADLMARDPKAAAQIDIAAMVA